MFSTSPSGNSSLSASTLVTVQILDVNDNSPVLVGDYSWEYLCTPRWEEQALVLASRDSDGPQHGGRLNFSLRSDATVRRNWKLTPINGEVNADEGKPAGSSVVIHDDKREEEGQSLSGEYL